MAMGKRARDRQPTMWVATTDLPTAASHPFYARLNRLLADQGFPRSLQGRVTALIAALLTLCGQLSDRMGLVLGQHIDHVRDLASAGRRAPIAGPRSKWDLYLGC